MIYESSFWKDDLLKSATSLRRRMTQQHWRDATFADVEKKTMLGFYAIRKLIEAGKLDDRTSRQRVPLTAYPSTGKRVTRRNSHRWWDLYDLANPRQMRLKLLPLCHQFVHSYVFSCGFDERRAFDSVLVSSDRERDCMLYSLSALELVRIFEAVGTNYPNLHRMTFNADKGDFDMMIETVRSHRSWPTGKRPADRKREAATA